VINRLPWRTLAAQQIVAAFIGLLLVNHVAAGPVSSFANVEFWVGAGSNRAAVAIDWDKNSTTTPALVWGFRWDGVATGQTMLSAIVAADPRLFAKSEGHGTLGSAVYGLGYDDGDGEFALDDDTAFDELGFSVSAGPADLAMPLDADDLYREGWFTGYWHYGVSLGNPYDGEGWKPSQVGMTGRTLKDGDWDSWVYTESFSARPFAENLVAAQPPASGDSADFNGDGVVDGSDFLAWQRGFGAIDATLVQGDANDDGLVDEADLDVWRDAFGTIAPASMAMAASSVPEPTGTTLGIAAMALLAGSARRSMRRSAMRKGVPSWR
jgi:hypothetical protein